VTDHAGRPSAAVEAVARAAGADEWEGEVGKFDPPATPGPADKRRRAPVGGKPRPLVVDTAASFLALAQDAPQWLVPELVASRGITMFHGRPRSMKSLSALSLAVNVSIGVPAFGSARFVAARPLRTVYMTEEDSRGLVATRLRWLLAGVDRSTAPEGLWLSARKGLSLETPDSQAQIHDVIDQLAPDLLLFDTGRAFAPSVDKGPSDAAGPIRFLRLLLADTCLEGIVLVHHDTKPTRDGQDSRARSERASGGALLAATDCPIGFERLSDRAALAVPDRYKPSTDPAPFRLTFESATPAGESFREWLRVSASASDERHEAEQKATASVVAALEDADTWLSGSALAERVGGRRQDVFATLRSLADAGRVATRDAKRGAKEYRIGIA
jgi:hypothetical protein